VSGANSTVCSLSFIFTAPHNSHHRGILLGFSVCTGDITYLNALGQEMIILNSTKAAVEILEKRSANYSDRPVIMMCGEIVGWNRTLALLQYGQRFREQRKYMSKLMGTRSSTEKFAPLQEMETAKFVARVTADPDSLVHQIRK
jgi:cytochrome P450